MAEARAIFGLGNPGAQYRNTRHNCGFRFIDQVAANYQSQLKSTPRLQSEMVRIVIGNVPVWLVKPMTFMNRSGIAFSLVTRYYDIHPENTIVTYDDLDLPVGSIRIRRSGGAGGHNGLSDIITQSGTRDIVRIRLGIGRPNHRVSTIPYVLSVPGASDQDLINQAIDDAVEALPQILTGNLEKVMTTLHSRGSQDSSKQASSI